MQLERSLRAGIVTGCPSLDRGSRKAEVCESQCTYQLEKFETDREVIVSEELVKQSVPKIAKGVGISSETQKGIDRDCWWPSRRENTLHSALVQVRDHHPANRTKDCIYKIKYNGCTKVYIGQTAKELHTRTREHSRKIKRPLRNADEYQALLKDSAIAEHALGMGHKIEVLKRELRPTSQRMIAEAVEIAKHSSVNRMEGVELESTRIPLYRTSLGVATADKPGPLEAGPEFGTLAGPSSRRDLIGQQSGPNSQS
ncbi:hypothetical protein T265_04081 [Opisthorchis viverrini]|uniref:GIY-YIG domain-containing protein n=1 Tax=Opisthorchis viverrini TaxID=6198 RepID=A0A074ZP98_OPIVI|nr:hypothetical protein T265_04081 [Opisthorchis viverrini]KER29233.1 hypothetical protein T265_04081 [Opisthorchis viverrini]